MKIPITLFPEHVRQQYQVHGNRVKNGLVYLEIRKAIYGLTQAGILANKTLRSRLAPDGYYEVAHIPGMWRHVTIPVQFALCVDEFGVKYVGKENADHIINTINKHYSCSEDWAGTLYCGITLDWNYKQHYLDISMPKYIPKLLQRFKHKTPTHPQHSPYQAPPKTYGAAAQDPMTIDTTNKLNEPRIKNIQRVI